jgi:hypothetical protein
MKGTIAESVQKKKGVQGVVDMPSQIIQDLERKNVLTHFPSVRI